MEINSSKRRMMNEFTYAIIVNNCINAVALVAGATCPNNQSTNITVTFGFISRYVRTPTDLIILRHMIRDGVFDFQQ